MEPGEPDVDYTEPESRMLSGDYVPAPPWTRQDTRYTIVAVTVFTLVVAALVWTASHFEVKWS